MKQVLRFLALAALICVPWVTQAQETITLTGNMSQEITPGTTYTFYDNGGPDGDYGTSQNYTLTLTCAGNITINFSQFVTESSSGCYDWDYMIIYDGDVSTGTQLVRGQTGCSTAALTTGTDIIAESGTMTIVWRSDGSTCAAGWTATITGEAAAACPKPNTLAVNNILQDEATLTWNGGEATAWQVCLDGDEDHLIDVNTASHTFTGLTPQTTHTAKVRANCSGTYSDWSTQTISFTTTAVATAVGDEWSDDFEGAECGWDLINGTLTNKWCWGTATNNGGTHALYVSNDDGATTNYSASGTKIFATKLLQFADGKYEFSYDWLCKGESTYDFLRVALVPASQTLTAGTDYSTIGTSSLPSGWTALDGGGKLNLQETWQNKVVAINVAAGNYYMVLVWRNDSGVYPPAAAVDNVSITRLACPYDVAGLEVADDPAVTTTTATINWTAGEATQWQVATKTGDANWSTLPTIYSTNSAALTGLTAATTYQVKVRAYCNANDQGTWCEPIPLTTTCPEYADVPFEENFDGHTVTSSYTPSSRTLPICWSFINTSTYSSNKWYPTMHYYSSTDYSNSSPNYIRFYIDAYSSSNYDPQDQYLVLPAVQDVAGLRIKLQARVYNTSSTYDATFKVGIMTDPTDASTFVEIAEKTPTTASYEQYIIPFNGYTGSGNHIAIKVEAPETPTATYTHAYRAVCIDDITVEEIPNCVEPSALQFVSSTTTTATLSWTASGSEPSWDIYYSTENVAPTTQTGTNTSDNPATIDGLTASTTYYVWVRAHCSDAAQSPWIGGISFATECETVTTFPFVQDFNSLTVANEIPICWDNSDGTTTSTSYKWCYNTKSSSNNGSAANGHEGKCVVFDSYNNSNGNTNFLKTPVMNLPAGKTMQLTFWYRKPVAGGDLSVYISTDGGTTYTTALATALAQKSSWAEQEIILGDYVGTENVVIVFKGTSNCGYGDAFIYLDDVTIAEAPTCIKPSSLVCDSKTAHTATLSWTNGATTQDAWQIAYSTDANFDPNSVTPDDVTTNPYTLTGLTNSTTYYAYVRANCGANGYSQWCTSKVTFTTTSGKQTPTSFAVDNASITYNSATVTWTGVAANDNHESYELYISTNSAMDNPLVNANLIQNITDETYTFTHLDPETHYYVWVRDNCGTDDGTSEWSTRKDFTTPVFCPAPTGVAVSSATAHGATISWTGTSDSYNVYVGKATVNSTTYDFEDNAISADFINDATNAWTVTTSDKHAGTYSIKSAGGFTSTQSDLTLTVNLTEAATITFWDKASSESSDYGRFLIDGVQKHQTSGTSGSWTERTYDLTAGSHTLVWRYYKDYSVNSGNDCYYVDDISITSVEVASWESYEAPASPYVLNDGSAIDPETDYAVKVVGVCESVESTRESATVLFTTSADCGASNVAVSNVSFHGADVTWDGSSDAGYMVMLGYDEVASDFVNENFAGGVPTSAEWTNDATYPWTAVDGYIKSGNGGHASTTSQLSLTVDMDAAGYIEFDAECRGEGTSSYWDYSTFTIDGTEKFKYAAHRTNDGFVHYSFPVAAGTHTFVWKYTKDSSTDPDGDYMAIDNLHIYTTNITWDEVEVVDVNNYTFDGLEDNTHYYVKVSPECNRTIESNAAEFITLALPTFNVKANNWYALSSPMHDAGQTYESVANVENLTTGTYDFLRYDEPTSTWKSQKSGGFSTLEPGRGYIYRRANDAVLKVDGEPNTGNVNVAITKNVDGWNLIGNPFMVPIRLNSTYMAPSSNAVLTSGGYKLSTNGMWTAITSSTDIAVGQAVLVKATTAGTLTLRPSASKSVSAAEEESNKGIVFSVSNDEFTDIAYARFSSEEGLPKISHLNPEAPMLSIDGYAIANLNEGTESFPMSFSGQGSYTLTVSGNTDVTGYLHLVDRLTGRDIDLLSTPSYSFTGSPVSDRFTVKLTPDANEGNSTSRFAIFDGNSLIVNGEGTLEVYDVMGRRLMSAEVTGSEYRIPGSDLHTGVYVLRMNGNSQKIVIK